MGLLDAIFGRTKLPKSKTRDIFAISTALVTLEALNLQPTGRAGICFKPVASTSFTNARIEVEELLSYTCKDTNTRYQIISDSYGYTWIRLEDPDFEDLVSNVYVVSDGLVERGFGEQLLCALFAFTKDTQKVYWIYNFKHGNFYPFAPTTNKERNSKLEFRLRSVMEEELPIEKRVEEWYPLWDTPV
jgi:hypothetical protein